MFIYVREGPGGSAVGITDENVFIPGAHMVEGGKGAAPSVRSVRPIANRANAIACLSHESKLCFVSYN